MKVLNYGSLNIDYVYQVPHLAGAKETVSSLGYQVYPGGKGLNQSIALARAGMQVLHLGKIGNDGLFLRDLLQESGVDTSEIMLSSGVSGHAVIQVDRAGENCIILHGGANEQIATGEIAAILTRCVQEDVLLLQAETSNGRHMMELAAGKGMRIAVNPSPVNDDMRELPLQLADWMFLNEVEGAALTSYTEPDAICDVLLRMYPDTAVILTLGSAGALYANPETRFLQEAFPVEAVDTTAAGDTFTGYYLACELTGMTSKAAMCAAAKAAALAVGRQGAAASIPYRKELV